MVRDSGDFKCIKTQEKIRAGQTEALLIVVMVRERWNSIPPRHSCQVIAETQATGCFREEKAKKEVRKNDSVSINKARSVPLRGVDSKYFANHHNSKKL